MAGEVDDFDVAFDALAKAAETAVAAGETKTPEQIVETVQATLEKTPEQIAAETKAAEEAAAAAKKAEEDAAAAKAAEEVKAGKTPEQLAAEEKAAADAAAAQKAADDAKIAADAAAAKKAEDDAKAAEEAAKQETPEQKKAREEFEASIKPYEPTAEEKAALAKFKEEFPNEYQAVEARLKSVDRDINARVYQAVQNILAHVSPRLQSVESTATLTAQEQHFAELHRVHPDYDTVIDKIPAWIKTLPSYAQVGAQAVYDGGNAQEVSALVADYKKATGMTTNNDAAAKAAADKAAADAAAAAAKAKAKPAGADDLAPVSGRRVVVTPAGSKDPNDFDGGWEEAAAAYAK